MTDAVERGPTGSSRPAAGDSTAGAAAQLNVFLQRMASFEDITVVFPSFLFIGSAAGAVNRAKLDQLGVKVIVNATRSFPCCFEKREPGAFEYARYPLDDTLTENVAQYFDAAADLIARAKREKRGVLVHCMMGVSRSSSLVLAYLVKHEGMALREALAFVRARRNVNPNSNFLKQLMDFEVRVRGGETSVRIARLAECGTPEEVRAHVARVLRDFAANRERTETVMAMREVLALSGGTAAAALRDALAALKKEAGLEKELPALVMPAAAGPGGAPHAGGGVRVLRTIRAESVVAEAEAERGRVSPRGGPGARRSASEGPEARRGPAPAAPEPEGAAALLAALALRAPPPPHPAS